MWNHRVIRKTSRDETWYEIHEVFYDDDGNPHSWTEGSVSPYGESVEELCRVLDWFKGATEKPVLEISEKDGKEVLVVI